MCKPGYRWTVTQTLAADKGNLARGGLKAKRSEKLTEAESDLKERPFLLPALQSRVDPLLQ
jgi:hypothetical protein